VTKLDFKTMPQKEAKVEREEAAAKVVAKTERVAVRTGSNVVGAMIS
jgi:hypothetical protein